MGSHPQYDVEEDAAPGVIEYPRVKLGLIDVNKGNKQVAHGIDRVLRPIDL